MMGKTKEFPLVVKEAALFALERGASQSQVARAFGVSRQLVSTWKKKKILLGTVANRTRSGRPKKFPQTRRKATVNPQQIAVGIQKDLTNFVVSIFVSSVKLILRIYFFSLQLYNMHERKLSLERKQRRCSIFVHQFLTNSIGCNFKRLHAHKSRALSLINIGKCVCQNTFVTTVPRDPA